MKKMTVIGTAFAIVLALSSCGDGANANSGDQNSSANASAEVNGTAQEEKSTEKIATDVNVEAFKKLVDENPEGQIVDVRTPEENAEGYIKGASLMNIFDADFESKLATLDKSKPVYVYCKMGGRSGKAMKKMQDLGFSAVYNLNGGFTAWSAAGYPVEK